MVRLGEHEVLTLRDIADDLRKHGLHKQGSYVDALTREAVNERMTRATSVPEKPEPLVLTDRIGVEFRVSNERYGKPPCIEMRMPSGIIDRNWQHLLSSFVVTPDRAFLFARLFEDFYRNNPHVPR
jgi:hypothetical protein